jgi:hypothetical protein
VKLTKPGAPNIHVPGNRGVVSSGGGDNNPLRAKISVQSDAGKFRICELNWDDQDGMSAEARRRFQALPVASSEKPLTETERPIYLRRGAYFEAINRALACEALTNTVFCGDIWEMDLAMPYALGANVHLLDRAAPFETFVTKCRRLLHTTQALIATSASWWRADLISAPHHRSGKREKPAGAGRPEDKRGTIRHDHEAP